MATAAQMYSLTLPVAVCSGQGHVHLWWDPGPHLDWPYKGCPHPEGSSELAWAHRAPRHQSTETPRHRVEGRGTPEYRDPRICVYAADPAGSTVIEIRCHQPGCHWSC